MRILIFNEFTSTFGGTDLVVNDEIIGLKKAGYTVELFSYHNKDFLKLKFHKKYYVAAKSCFKTFKLIEFQDKIDQFKPDIVHFHNIYQLFRTPIWNNINLHDAKLILHLHNYYPFCLNSFFFAKSTCTKCLDENSWLPGIKLKCYNSSLLQTVFTSTSRPLPQSWIKLTSKIDKFIAVSKFITKVYSNSGIDSQKITFLPNAIEMNNIKTPSHKGKFVLYLGALTKLKGVEWVCQIAKTLTEIPFIIAGEGNDYLYLKEKYKTLSNLEFTGYVMGEKKIFFFKIADF
ncbi:MAG: glycosyltransferase [Ignavibacteriaceae bacterium]|nr:glycosyltransferase [Ignavibacteriaceae bacterium]